MKDNLSPDTVHDPVCGMDIDPAKAAAVRTFEGKLYHFCSAGCAKSFDADPKRYAARDKNGS